MGTIIGEKSEGQFVKKTSESLLQKLQDIQTHKHEVKDPTNYNTLFMLMSTYPELTPKDKENIKLFWRIFYNIIYNLGLYKENIKRGKLKTLCQMYIIKLYSGTSFSEVISKYQQVANDISLKPSEYIYQDDFQDQTKKIVNLKIKNVFDNFFRSLHKYNKEPYISLLQYEQPHLDNSVTKLNIVNLLIAIINNMKSHVESRDVLNIIKTFSKFFKCEFKKLEIYNKLYDTDVIKIGVTYYKVTTEPVENFKYDSELEISKALNSQFRDMFLVPVNREFIHNYIYELKMARIK